ncbi:MAG TPA: hypothetical protein VEG38_17720 [Acidimicrobiia bacterium]|nr:hypothetical protein [Acidimicrobiia bacterium]
MHPAGVAASTRVRTLANELLEQMPSVYCSVMRRRHPEWFLVDSDTDVVIEGYQSCGNTFARKAMEHANAKARIASHSHSWANVARGLQLHKPVVILLRPPLDAIASHAVRMRLDDLDRELRRYHRFFGRVAGVPDRVVLAPFEVTSKRFGDVIRAVNTRFGTEFAVFDHTDPGATAEVFAEMDREAASSPSELDRMWRVARPNAERATATQEMKARLTSPQHGAALARCEEVHDQLVRVGTLS